MAGCSIVFLTMFIFWPLMLVAGIFLVLASAAAGFVTSPAFPMLIASGVFGVLAGIDVVRFLWQWYKEGKSFVFSWDKLRRPLILGAISLAFFVAMCITTGTVFWNWWQTEVATSASN